MATKKQADTPYKKVKITFRDQNNEKPIIHAGTNNVVENGKLTLKRYRIRPGEAVELPETVVQMLKDRFKVVKDKSGNSKHLPIYFVEEV
jgi:hypothetical protein